MKIVHLITRVLRAGSEENTIATCDHQVKTGNDVYLVYGTEYLPEMIKAIEALGVKCICADNLVHPVNPIKDAQAARDIKKLYQEIQPDIIHTHQSKAGIIGRLAAIGINALVVHTVHIAPFINVSTVKKLMYVTAEKYCARHTDAIISVSEGMKSACLQNKVGTLEKHYVVYSGMNIKKFQTQDATKPELLDINGIDNKKPFIALMIAAFEGRKRHRQLLEELHDHLHKDPNIHIVFCGQGELLDTIREQVKAVNLENQVHFAGFVDNVENYVHHCDIGVLVSEREGLPRVLVQFAAANKPVVVSHLPGIEEIVQDGVNGLIHGENDLTAVARSISELAGESDRLSNLTDGAFQQNVSAWDISLMGGRIDDVYEDAIKRRNSQN